MSTKSQTIEQQAAQASNETAAPQQTKSLQDIVAVVRCDSQTDAKAYLQETEVPHGGE